MSIQDEFSVRKMCIVLRVRERGYYQWQKTQEKQKQKRKQEEHFRQAVFNAFIENNKTYRVTRIKRYLNEEKGIEISEWIVRRIMRENGLYAIPETKFKKPSSGKKNGKDTRYSDNIVKQNFKTEWENEVWVSDITYIKTQLGWVYLAVVMDLYNREIVGYSVSKQINTELVLRATTNALGKNPKGVQGTIFHSDRGSQYTSKSLKKLLHFEGIKQSMSRPGCPYDNSPVESFFSSLKRECIHRKEYTSIKEVEKDLFQYIELFYNRKRLHSFLDYKSPINYKLQQRKLNLTALVS